MKLVQVVNEPLNVDYFGIPLTVFKGWYVATTIGGQVIMFNERPFYTEPGEWFCADKTFVEIQLVDVDLDIDFRKTLKRFE